jgi:hypothetical protein
MGALFCCCYRRTHEPKEPAPQTCCESFAWHLREYRSIYMILATLLMVAGVGVIIGGIVTFVDPSNRSTVSDAYNKYLTEHAAEESRIIRATTITTSTGVTVPSVEELIPFRFVADAKGTETKAMTLTDTYWKTTIARPMSATLSIVIRTDVLWQGRTISTESITLPVASTVNGSDLLTEACFVIERSSSLEYTDSANYKSCFYPSTAASQRYHASTSSTANVTLSFRSGYSPYVTMLQRFGKGDLNDVRDEAVLTSSTPYTLMGVGVAVFVIGLLTLCTFCCCVRRNATNAMTEPKYV